jgi:Ca2+-dependent lipid-binding protein
MRTRTLMNTLNPIWRERYSFYYPPDKKNNQTVLLRFECWDYDEITSDDFMGYSEIEINQFKFFNCKKLNLALKPRKKEKVSGTITIKLRAFIRDKVLDTTGLHRSVTI